MTDAVTICVPAYRAETFLARTIESALNQSWPDTRVVVSVDAGGDGTAAVAQRFAGRGVVVAMQPQRLGWVANVNAAMAMARTPFACTLPHDDVLHPEFVASCMAVLEANPGAVLAYSDIRFGRVRRLQEPSISGTPSARMAAFIDNHFDAVGFRGVFDRRRAPRHAVPDFAIGDYAADTLWMARMVGQGGIVRVPRVLYRKQMRGTSVHAGWKRASLAERDERWIVHCIELERIARETLNWDSMLEAAWEKRLRRRMNRPRWPRWTAGVLDPAVPLRPQAEAMYARLSARPAALSQP